MMKGNTFVVNLMISGAQNVYSVPVQLNYDPAELQLVNVSNGGFLSQDGQAVALVHREDETTGTLQITATRPPGSGGVSGQGTVVTTDIPGEGQRTDAPDHYPGWSARPRATGHHGEWSAGIGDRAIADRADFGKPGF